MLPGHERAKVDEPMDTIFVKQVRANSPAAEAGLRTGDRVVSVDGTPTRGEQYASVVQRIQQAGPWLRLLVVSKEDDILQRVRKVLALAGTVVFCPCHVLKCHLSSALFVALILC